MENDVTGKKELERLSFDWAIQKPGLMLTFSTLCCASGTCDDYVRNRAIQVEEARKISLICDGKNAFEIRRTFGSLRTH